MKVYVLEKCVRHEGAVLMGVYSTEETALAAETTYLIKANWEPLDISYQITEVEIDQPAVTYF